MRKVFNVNMAILAIFAAIGFVMMSCDDDPPRDELFENSSDFSIRVSNSSPVDLVAYAGSLQEANRVGGVPARTSNFGLPNNKKFFTDTPNHFQLIFITRDQYDKNPKNPETYNNLTYTRTYVFWNGSSGDNSKVYEISDKMGGLHKLQVWNTSNYDVEFRVNGTSGPTLGYAPSGMVQGYINVEGGSYLIYPVFLRFNKFRNVMESIIPIAAATQTLPDRPYSYSFGFPEGAAVGQTQILNLTLASQSMNKIQTGVVYVQVCNGYSDGIRIQRGTTPMYAFDENPPTEVINAGQDKIYSILLPNTPGTNMFAESTRTNFTVNIAGYPVNVHLADDPNTVTFDLLADYQYIINIDEQGQGTIVLDLNGGNGKPFKFIPEPVTGLN